jgi:curved DNA-binding protein CbpA
MTDSFALLDEARRPWLDPDRLKQKFLDLSSQYHPDRVHAARPDEKAAVQDRYVALNAAYQCLSDPKSRLRHLLELELNAKPEEIQQIPGDLMDLFMGLGLLTRQIDAFLKQKAAATSPLLKVQLFEQNEAWSDQLIKFQKGITARRDHLLAELKQLDADWIVAEPSSARRAALLKRLEEFYRLLSYFARWTAQLQERLVHLAV